METELPIIYSSCDSTGGRTVFDRYLYVALMCFIQTEEGRIRMQSKFQELVDELANTGFYTAPASTKFHEAYEGGLVEHSLRVVNCAIDLVETKAFKSYFSTNERMGALIICCLLHDTCKIGLYEKYPKKELIDGVWKTIDAYKWRESNGKFLGHGEDSMAFMLRWIPESTYEMLAAVRHHMGPTDCANQNTMWAAARAYPLVNILHFADMLSTASY